MKASFPERFLRCPRCSGEGTLTLQASSENELEVREGTLSCGRCGATFELDHGIAHLLVDPPEHVRKEAAGLAVFAEHMRAHGWTDERILELPYVDDGYWFVQAQSFEQLQRLVPFEPGQSILDVGSNTCWASSRFAEMGLEAIALDISTARFQGLETADVYLLAARAHFERVLGTMNDMPLASGSLDYVFCCEVLHHNDLAGLRRTFQEAFRVLKPGGRMLVVNETLKCLRDPNGIHLGDMGQFEGYEHAHWALQYLYAARRAGFSVSVLEPAYERFFEAVPLYAEVGTSFSEIARRSALFALRSSRFARRAYLNWLNHVQGGVSLSLIATKAGGPMAAR
jgi:SAM-dependent methyltransferase/uncharacterized protein YbaR (Trm112 family)